MGLNVKNFLKTIVYCLVSIANMIKKHKILILSLFLPLLFPRLFILIYLEQKLKSGSPKREKLYKTGFTVKISVKK